MLEKEPDNFYSKTRNCGLNYIRNVTFSQTKQVQGNKKCCKAYYHSLIKLVKHFGPVVQKPISTNPELNI